MNNNTRQMGNVKWQPISRSRNSKTLRQLANQYKGMGYETHITPNGKQYEILWVHR